MNGTLAAAIHRSELEAAWTRIERLEAAVVELFNDHMAEVLTIVAYGNVDRNWLDRGGAGTNSGGGSGAGRRALLPFVVLGARIQHGRGPVEQ